MHSLPLYRCVKHFSMPENSTKTSYKRKRNPTKNILHSLFTTQRENETTWETRKGSVKKYTVFSDFLEWSLQQPATLLCTNAKLCLCLCTSNTLSLLHHSTWWISIQASKHYIITCCASSHRRCSCTCYKAARRLALLAKAFLPKAPALLLQAQQVSSR